MEKEILNLIDRYWRFDDMQHPISSWHEKQDLMVEINKLFNKPTVNKQNEQIDKRLELSKKKIDPEKIIKTEPKTVKEKISEIKEKGEDGFLKWIIITISKLEEQENRFELTDQEKSKIKIKIQAYKEVLQAYKYKTVKHCKYE